VASGKTKEQLEEENRRLREFVVDKLVLYNEPKKYCRTGDAEPTMTADEALEYSRDLERR
jgi:hypothetical protein